MADDAAGWQDRGPAGEPVFDAVLYPHRSLSDQGFRYLVAALVAVWLVIGTGFLVNGAWPVFGLMGLELGLVYAALRASFRAGRLHERVRLTPARLRIERIWPNGRRHRWSFQPQWLQVSVPDRPTHDSQLELRSHGRRLVIGAFLTPQERCSFGRRLYRELTQIAGPPGARR